MIKLEHVNYGVFDKKTNRRKEILKDIDLEFIKNKLTVITGHNGSGKSTLIKLLMGISKPNSGKIIFNGEDITDLDITSRAKLGITMAFQQPIKFKGITVKSLLDVAIGKKTKIDEVCEYLSSVGLCAKEYINREVDDTLSGGELKRIELAIALAKGGDLFLFDEPEAGIDLWSFDELIKVFKKLKDKTVIIVSHQQKILDIADYVLLLNNSDYKIGPKDEILPYINEARCARLSEVEDGQN